MVADIKSVAVRRSLGRMMAPQVAGRDLCRVFACCLPIPLLAGLNGSDTLGGPLVTRWIFRRNLGR